MEPDYTASELEAAFYWGMFVKTGEVIEEKTAQVQFNEMLRDILKKRSSK